MCSHGPLFCTEKTIKIKKVFVLFSGFNSIFNIFLVTCNMDMLDLHFALESAMLFRDKVKHGVVRQ